MSRPDNIGFFWQDVAKEKGRSAITRVMPAIPETGWTPPRDFPNIFNVPWISLDYETKDPELLTHGPGWARGSGHIIGASICVPGASWYFPCRHEVNPEQNLDPVHLFAWMRDVAKAHGKKPIIGGNLIYDAGWGGEEGVVFEGIHYDVQFAEALLSEGLDVNLDALGERYLGRGKETNLLYQWLADYYGGTPNEKQRANMFRSPPSLAGPYAQGDVVLPANILPLQWAEMDRQGLLPVFDMECRLIPLIIAMRRAGVSVDINRAEQVFEKLDLQVKEFERQLKHMVGFEVNPDASESMQRAFLALGLKLPIHPKKGTVSFEKALLAQVEHPIAELVGEIKKRKKVKNTFIQKYVLEKHVNGKLYCSLHPLRSDDGGTRSGRFSMSIPNGQNIPSRDEELAPLVRGCFIPDPGHPWWRRYDYDQVEYRMLAHYAIGRGSDELREQYIRNPKTDYHVNTQNLVTRYTGLEIPRKPIKNFNFGMTFGMGQAKMIRTTNMELRKLGGAFTLDGKQLYEAYHEACPYTRETATHYSNLASDTGIIQTVLGRRSRFDLWEPSKWQDSHEGDADYMPALPYEDALFKYGNIRRSKVHKALNRLLQGSGTGDVIKMAMLKLWDSGVLSVVGVPRLTVHDELDFSDAGGNEEAWKYVRHILETAITFRVPILASLEIGPDWGHCEEVN